MKTPSNSFQISRSWVAFILTQHECKKCPESVVTVEQLSVENATKPGESFNAELVKVDVTAKVKNDKNSCESKTYSLIVKFFSRDPLNREMVRKLGYHLREFEMYSSAAQRFNAFQAERTNNAFPIHLPEFVYGKCARKEYVLVMRNLKEDGYVSPPKESGLTVDQLLLAVERLARLHGVSYAFHRHHDLLATFPCFHFNRGLSRLMKAMVFACVDNTLAFLRTQPDCADIVDGLQSGRGKLPLKFEALWDDQSRHSLLCLTHGDFWASNLLFLPGEDGHGGPPRDVALIDWQICQWNSPAMDLHYLLSTSTTLAVRQEHADRVLRHYHEAFTAVTTALSAPAPFWSLQEFRAEFDRLSMVGLLMGICVIQGTLSKAGERLNMQQRERETTTCASDCLKRGVRTVAAKVAVPAAFHPSCGALMRLSLRAALKDIGTEMVSGENRVMNDRIVDLVKEAQSKGLLEVLNL